MWEVDSEGGGRGQEFTRELSVLSTHFISEPKTVLKIKYSYFFNGTLSGIVVFRIIAIKCIL